MRIFLAVLVAGFAIYVVAAPKRRKESHLAEETGDETAEKEPETKEDDDVRPLSERKTHHNEVDDQGEDRKLARKKNPVIAKKEEEVELVKRMEEATVQVLADYPEIRNQPKPRIVLLGEASWDDIDEKIEELPKVKKADVAVEAVEEHKKAAKTNRKGAIVNAEEKLVEDVKPKKKQNVVVSAEVQAEEEELQKTEKKKQNVVVQAEEEEVMESKKKTKTKGSHPVVVTAEEEVEEEKTSKQNEKTKIEEAEVEEEKPKRNNKEKVKAAEESDKEDGLIVGSRSEESLYDKMTESEAEEEKPKRNHKVKVEEDTKVEEEKREEHHKVVLLMADSSREGSKWSTKVNRRSEKINTEEAEDAVDTLEEEKPKRNDKKNGVVVKAENLKVEEEKPTKRNDKHKLDEEEEKPKVAPRNEKKKKIEEADHTLEVEEEKGELKRTEKLTISDENVEIEEEKPKKRNEKEKLEEQPVEVEKEKPLKRNHKNNAIDNEEKLAVTPRHHKKPIRKAEKAMEEDEPKEELRGRKLNKDEDNNEEVEETEDKPNGRGRKLQKNKSGGKKEEKKATELKKGLFVMLDKRPVKLTKVTFDEEEEVVLLEGEDVFKGKTVKKTVEGDSKIQVLTQVLKKYRLVAINGDKATLVSMDDKETKTNVPFANNKIMKKVMDHKKEGRPLTISLLSMGNDHLVEDGN